MKLLSLLSAYYGNPVIPVIAVSAGAGADTFFQKSFRFAAYME